MRIGLKKEMGLLKLFARMAAYKAMPKATKTIRTIRKVKFYAKNIKRPKHWFKGF